MVTWLKGAVDASAKQHASSVLNAINDPVILVCAENKIVYSNMAAEQFFLTSRRALLGERLNDYVPVTSPLLALLEQVRNGDAPVNEYRLDISSPRLGDDRIVDAYVSPAGEGAKDLVIVFRSQSMAAKFDEQMSHRGAARSVTTLAAMLGHEIKNPLSGIRGAAQLLETVVGDEDRALTQLIREETDRIVSLVDKMEVFSDERPIDRQTVNIHVVLDRVRRIAESGFGENVHFADDFDPSLPDVLGNRDQLIQVFLNLVKNAVEATKGVERPTVTLTTAYRPGIRLYVPGANERIALPLEFCVIDNGPGVSPELKPFMFDPFITSKTNGTGLGLALVAKVIGDHGGVIECHSQPGKTIFRVLMPVAKLEKPVSPTSGIVEKNHHIDEVTP
ncbi:MAG: ATP-binding protein [Pseudomonadota bacterium]